MNFKSIKGTRDILPRESHRWQGIEATIRSIMHTFNYGEIRTPVFEETRLFARGIGELTDIVGKEMYTFEDRSGTNITLKPEMTASVVRAFIQHNLGEQQPLVKVYYFAPMFRQERPQAGRLRQFHQFGAEAIGGLDAIVDAEVIALSMEIYAKLRIRNISLKINSVGCEQCRPQYKEELKRHLGQIYDKLSEESQRRFEQNPLRILDSKNEVDQRLTSDAPLMKDHLCEACESHFDALQSALTVLNVPFTVDGRIVRGLDYYTKTAYEIVSEDLGSQDALLGGGRYDLLVKELGGKCTPAVGFAAGMERLIMVMEKQRVNFDDELHPLLFIASADDAGRTYALKKTIELRRDGIASELDLLNRSLKAQMREADRQMARYVLVIGQKEVELSEANLKEMKSGKEHKIKLQNLAEELRKPA